MKKALFTLMTFSYVLTASAQDNSSFDPLKDRQLYFDILNICAVLGGMYLIAAFIQKLLKHYYSYRIKNRMLDKGTEEGIVRQLLQPDRKETGTQVLLWFCMLAAIGCGIMLVYWFRPFGLISLAILAFSLAAGFGAYYFFSKGKQY